MWTNEMITKGKMLDLITNCLNYMSLFLLEMYGDRPVWGIFMSLLGLRGRNVFIVMVLASLKSLSSLLWNCILKVDQVQKELTGLFCRNVWYFKRLLRKSLRFSLFIYSSHWFTYTNNIKEDVIHNLGWVQIFD